MNRFPDTFDRLRQAEGLTRILLEDAGDMLTEPPQGESDRWLAAIAEKLHTNVAQQFQIQEDTDYMADVLDQFPAWHPQVVHLQQEHRLLCGQIAEIADRMQRELTAGRISHECRRQFADWIHWYRDHQRRETALTQEAFVLEVGQGE